jgi:signal transduction histidine kinase/CheY-like chemotaxis protein
MFIAILTLKFKPEISRLIYLTVYPFAVFFCAMLFGKDASIEIYYTFYYLLLFIIFSYRTEKTHIVLFASIATILWLLLITFNFTINDYEDISQEGVSTIVYPISFVGNFILILFTLIHFSYANAKSLKKKRLDKKNALDFLELKTIYLKAINQEIREPLNAIIGLTHILREDKPREDQKNNIESLHKSSKNLLELLNNVLNLDDLESKKTKLNTKPTNLTLLINEIIAIHHNKCAEKNIDLNVSIDSNFPTILIDNIRYSQIINNLLSNAIKFTHKGKIDLKIVVKTVNSSSITFSTEITDTGIGIPEDKLPLIWEKFTQATESTTRLYGGTGLGLPIVMEIVKSMNSNISIKSTPNVGSKFYFDLTTEITKVKDAMIEESIESKLANTLHKEQKAKHILIADDNNVNNLVLKNILKKDSYNIDVVVNGLEAVKATKKKAYDLILMDLDMPVMDGEEAIKEIRKFNIIVPIIIITASNSFNKDTFTGLNINKTISKPFIPKDLLATISDVFNISKY